MGKTWGNHGSVTGRIDPRFSVEVDPQLGVQRDEGMSVCLHVSARGCATAAGSPPLVGADFIISVQKTMFDYTPKTDKIHDIAFAARGMNRLDSWHLLEIAIDPAYEGKGESQRLSA